MHPGLAGAIDLSAGAYLAAQAVRAGAGAADVSMSLAHVPLWQVIFALMFSAMVGIVSGAYPAVGAASLDPITALKYE